MKDMKEFGIKCQEMQRDLDCAQKRLAEYYAQTIDSIMRVNIESVINLPLPVNREECIKTLLENNITLMNLYQTRSVKFPNQIYVILQNGIPARFFEIKFEELQLVYTDEPALPIHLHQKHTVGELMRYDPEPTQKEPVRKDHSFKEVKKRNEFFRRR